MKKTTNRIISVLVCLAMTIALIPAAVAAEAKDDPYAELRASIYQHLEAKDDPYAELKASIFRQLEAQNALQHYELHVAALIPQEAGAVPMRASNQSWYAPDGGVLCYSYDWTYRDESGYVDSIQVYLDKEGTNELLLNRFSTVQSAVEFVIGVVGAGVPVIGPFITLYGAHNFLMNALSEHYIKQAGGYARISTTYDSISGSGSTVIVGWEGYPTVTLNHSSAYNVSFTYGNP